MAEYTAGAADSFGNRGSWFLGVLVTFALAAFTFSSRVQAQNFVLGDSTVSTDQMTGLCENNCFNAAASFSTVPYYTLGQPRSLTFVYNDYRVHQRPAISADVRITSGNVNYWIMSAKLNNLSVTFLNGDTELFFQPRSITDTLRLAGNFDASSWSNGVYTLEVTAQGHFTFPVTTTITKTYTTTIVIHNEDNSTVGKGWTIAGVQKLYTSGSSRYITNGDGSITLFSALNTTALDYSKLATYGASDYVRTFVDGSKSYFNSAGLMYKTVDRLGNETLYNYTSGKLTSVYDPQRVFTSSSGTYLQLTYGSYGVDSVKEVGGGTSRITTVAYDGSNRIRKFVDPDGDSTKYTYDGSGWLDTIISRGVKTRYSYHPYLRKVTGVTVTDIATGTVINTSYNSWECNCIPVSSTSQWSLASTCPIVGVNNWFVTSAKLTTYTINRYGQPVRTTAPDNQVTTIKYFYTSYLPVKITYPTGGSDTLAYEPNNPGPPAHPFPIYFKGSGTGEVNYYYDGTYRQLIAIRGSRVAETEYRYLGTGGRIDSVRHGEAPSPVRWSYYTYDGRNRVTSFKDPDGHVTTYTYDGVTGNVDTTKVPGNILSVRRFDAVGRDSTSSASGASYTRQTRYDVMNRVTKMWSAGAADDTTIVTYNALNPVRVRGPGGHIYKSEINALGWVTKRYATDDTTTSYNSYVYDGTGLLLKSINRRADTVKYIYDQRNRLVSRAATGMPTDSFTYSSNGRVLTSRRSGVSVDSTFLSIRMQPDSIVRRLGGKRYKLAYTYDTITMLPKTFSVVPDFSINFITRTFAIDTATGVLDTLNISGYKGGNSVFTYNADHIVTGVTSPSSISQSYSYTSHHAPYNMSFSPNTGFARSYTIDSLDRKSQEIAQFSGSDPATLSTYTYDGLGQLLKVRRSTATGCSFTADIVFGAGTTGCSVSSSTTVDSSTYDTGGNRLVSGASYTSTGNRLAKWPGYDTLTYDSDGNLKTRKHGNTTDTLFWGPLGQLDSLHSGSRRITYEYNGDGQLVQRSTNGSVDRYFLWDGNGNLLAELKNQSGTVSRIAEYIYAGGQNPIAMATDSLSSSLVRYMQTDGLGNVVGVTNGGTAQQHTVFGAWGSVENQLINTMADTNRIGWKGLMYEGDSTQLYYVRNRWYDPKAGRFVSEDPIGIEGGLNLYTFAGNDPINGSDPTGLCPQNAPLGAICIDLFISAGQAWGFKGDNRSHVSNASPNRSRVQMVIIPNNFAASYATVTPSCLKGFGCKKPLTSNKWRITVIDDKSFRVDFSFRNSYGGDLGPDIDGNITFTWDADRKLFKTSGEITKFPTMGLYMRAGDLWRLLEEHAETWPGDLFDIREKYKW